MGKTSSTSDVLKSILKDVSNVQNIIDDSKKLEKNYASIDFDNEQELKQFIEATKTIVENLKEEANKIYQYFDSNYSIWDVKLKESELDKEKQVNNNNDCDGKGDSTTNHIESEVNEVNTNVENDVSSRVPSPLDECNDKDDKSISDKKENENTSEENPGGEQKLFIKCVDINKLINPDILPHLTSPKPLQTNCDDTVLIISDSDDDGHKKNKKMNSDNRTKFGNKKTMSSNRNISRSHKKNSYSDSDVDMPNVSVTSKRSNLRRKATKLKYKDISESENSSLSDSASGSEARVSARRKKNIKSSIPNKINVHIEKDKKLSYKCYVPLPRVQCEMLKANYLAQKQIDEVNRLTNLRNFRKRVRKNSSSSISSAGSDKIRPKSKHKKKSKESESSDMDVSKEDDDLICTSLPDVVTGDVINLDDKQDDKTVTEDLLENILNRLSSDSEKEEKTADEEKESDSKKDKDKQKDNHTSESENDNSNGDASDKPKETEKEDTSSDKQSDDHKKEDPKGDGGGGDADDDDDGKRKKGSNWRKDKLLTGKLTDTDSEEELEKFKKQHDQAKSNARDRIKKKLNKVIDSDSESDKKSSSENEKDKNKSSSSSSEEEDQKKQKKQKKSRIKRVEDSSDEDCDKSTRKTIRKVIANDSLAESTKRAEKEEEERKQRILERQKKYNQIFDCDKPEDASIDKLVLDFNEESKEELLTVNQDLVKKLKPHQGKGVQFMWDACFESVERAKSTEGSGCILAHCMGLGKTLQVIALTHTLLINDDTKVSKVLVVCPLNTVLNWSSEYKKWLSDIDGEEVEVFELVSCKQNHREFVVEDWYKSGGVLIIGYDMFRNLTNPNNKRLKKKSREIFLKGLVNPGPDLVICDEGHLLKNEKTNLSVAMNKIRTARRIVLTGTPMQNNLKEYYCMVQFVKPNLLGTYKEYMNRFVSPITNGQYTDSTAHDINVMRRRAHVLHKLLDGVVQRKDYAVLMPFLPPKHEYVLFLTLSDTQIKLYQHYIDHFSQRPAEDKLKTSFLFTDFQEFQRICTHPRVLLLKSQENQNKYITSDEEESEGSIKDFIDDDESEAKSTSSSSSSSGSDSDASNKSKPSKKIQSKKRMTRTAAAASGIDINQIITESTETDGTEWWRQYCNGEELDNIKLSSKLYLLFLILQECELIGDKLLVFSQSLYSLNIIEYFLAKIDEATQQGDQSKVCGFSGSWALGLDYFRLDGSSSCDNRAAWCKSFNSINNPRARLFLISTKAGGLGINLVGANRVIIFDVSWNPSHDVQSIYRVYRFGQTKPCYIYRFVIWGTMEMKIYERQVNKQAISKRVIDEQQIDRHYNQNDLSELYKFDPDPIDQITPLVPKDVLLAELLIKEKDRIFKYHEHQSLLENKEDEELNEAERKAAWEEFESEKTRVNTANNMGWIRNLPLNTITMALTNIVQKDNPGWTKEQVKRVVPLVVEQLRQQVDSGDMSLFQRIVTEVKLIQQIQQSKFQEIYRLQQLQQQQQQLRRFEEFRNMLTQRGLGLPTNPNEIVELND